MRKEASALPLTPDAQEALHLFYAANTQWRTGFSGATGLDYVALEIIARSLDIPLTDALPLLQTLEAEQLNIWAEEQKATNERD